MSNIEPDFGPMRAAINALDDDVLRGTAAHGLVAAVSSIDEAGQLVRAGARATVVALRELLAVLAERDSAVDYDVDALLEAEAALRTADHTLARAAARVASSVGDAKFLHLDDEVHEAVVELQASASAEAANRP